ncbi:hypothetical protein C5F64_10200 [Photobacterium damselae subsp. damselae]|uniref:glycosyltransferase family 2 protein n=1 Tax=Photobacterium damselae TaxID=38293 RepID=UPI000D07EC07|nr:glycosyltransferase family 2 protein [Photobacterium damselae]PSB87047.1 hypothetical protein C5F64_10200 [Photobacterium damselae subsp. damselae]
MNNIDVLIPMYNAEKTIKECIKSLLNQTMNVNIIVCDDCSTDNSFNIVSNFKLDNLTIIRNDENIGYLKTFNKLLECSQAEYISFVDADDFIEKDKIKKQFDYLNKNKNIDIVGCNFRRIDNNNKFESASSDLPLEHDDIIKAILLGEEAVCGSSLMIRKAVKVSIGGYRDYFIGKVGEDIDWVARISQKHNINNINYCGYNYRMTFGSLTRNVSYDVEKIHIHDFIIFLFESRLKNNSLIDIVDCNNELEIAAFFEKFKLAYDSYPYKLYAKTAFGHALNKNYKSSLIDLAKCFHKKTSLLVIVKTILSLFMIFLLPHGLLLKLKEKLKIKNIAKRLTK